MILDVALGIVLGVVMLVMGFFAFIWSVNWWREHWKNALIIGVPLALFLYAGATDNSTGKGWSGVLLIVAILLELWRSHSQEKS